LAVKTQLLCRRGVVTAYWKKIFPLLNKGIALLDENLDDDLTDEIGDAPDGEAEEKYLYGFLR